MIERRAFFKAALACALLVKPVKALCRLGRTEKEKPKEIPWRSVSCEYKFSIDDPEFAKAVREERRRAVEDYARRYRACDDEVKKLEVCFWDNSGVGFHSSGDPEPYGDPFFGQPYGIGYWVGG